MASTQKKRSKSLHGKPNPNSPPLFGLLKEPSPDLFPSKGEFLRLLVVVSIAATVAMACNYVVKIINIYPKPFCDTDVMPEDSLPDFCEPCPINGECVKGHLECVRGYKKVGRLCVEDGEISQTAKKFSEWVQLRVCEAYVQFLCYGTGKIWFQEDEIWKELDELNERVGLKNDSYTYAKQKAMQDTKSSLEMRTDFHGINEFKCPDWLAERYKPLLCYLRQWASKHALFIVPISVLIVGFMILCTVLLRRLRRIQYLSTRAEQLYQQVCDILEENAIMAKSGSGEAEPWVVASRLRDHLLLPRERKNHLLWKKVEELVQEDSRVDQYPKLVKGESKVVWEWQVEGSLSSLRKRTKVSAGKLKSSGGMHEFPGKHPQQILMAS